MKLRPGTLPWIVIVVLALAGLVVALRPSSPAADAVKAVAETRQLLRQQGFKTDLSEFDFSTSAELRAREAVLTNTVHSRHAGSLPEHPNLMQSIGHDSAVVVWKLDSLNKEIPSRSDESDRLTWEAFRAAVNGNQSLYDPACMAILSGPIRFNLNAQKGSAMLLPHLAVMKNLAQTLGDRTMLALHDGNQAAAWTNLMAATRLVAAYEPGPVEIACLVRFACASLAFNTVWQALQTNCWTDEQLARLQQEWESDDYFSSLPETAAFNRACFVADCERERSGENDPKPTFGEFMKEATRYPLSIWYELNRRWEKARFRQRGNFDLEKELMHFYRDREVELRNAVKAPTWAAMRQLPGVTNYVPFQSGSRSRVQALMNLKELSLGFQRQGFSFLGRAAQAEAQRRLIITALSLERHRAKHGSFPNGLASLAPEFLKTVPVDFMDGQPLRYRLTADGHFLLYSVGLDCVDNGGQMRKIFRDMGYERPAYPGAPPPEFDIVWPLPASVEAVQAQRKQEERAQELQNRREQERESDEDWQKSPRRQSRVENILAASWQPDAGDLAFQGKSLPDYIRNEKTAGTNHLSLAELLALKPIITGSEPEDLTFEVPASYDAITNLCDLRLMVDADPEDPESNDAGGKQQEIVRAPDGNCLLVWHTIYDPAGPHAVQVQLTASTERSGIFSGKGPAIPVTTSNLCQFSLDSATYDIELGATFHARLPEANGQYTIECLTTNGAHLKTLTGSTTNGEFKVVWNLVDDHGHRLTGETFNSIVHITLPDSSRAQTLRGP
jgi:hypothetical protein